MRAMEDQMISRKAQVKSVMIFYVAMLSVLHVLLQVGYFSKVAYGEKHLPAREMKA